jgi:hypothetical protein
MDHKPWIDRLCDEEELIEDTQQDIEEEKYECHVTMLTCAPYITSRI